MEALPTAEAREFLDALPAPTLSRANGYWEIYSEGQLVAAHQLRILENGTWCVFSEVPSGGLV